MCAALLLMVPAGLSVVGEPPPASAAGVPVTGGLVTAFESDTGLTSSFGVVSSWNDSSGRGNHLAAVGSPGLTATPTGAPAVAFDGVEDSLQRDLGLSGLPTAGQDRTVLVVARYRSLGLGGFSWGRTRCNKTFGLGVDTTGRYGVQGWCTANQFSSNLTGTGTGWAIHSATLGSGQLRQFVDGELVHTVAHAFETKPVKMVMGAELDGRPRLDMDVAGVLVYNRSLPDGERAAVESYLRDKYLGAPGTNTPPEAQPDVASTESGGSVTIDVLANDTDAESSLDPASVHVVDPPANGTATPGPDGRITYLHDGTATTSDTFTYSVADDMGGRSAAAAVSINVDAGSGPSGFSEQPVVQGLSLPVSTTFLPDGRMLVLEKGGRIVIADLSHTPAQVATYLQLNDIASERERGLMDITLDPDFASNGHFYVYYAKNSVKKWRIARFTHVENSGGTTSRASLGSEFLVWENPNTWTNCCHFGGGLDVGPDGRLYLTTGEEFIADQAQDLTIADGKIIRVNRDGTIPGDNPWADGPGGTLDEIWAYGLRNPFRARWDLPTGRLFIGEVGGNDDARAHEDINLGRRGANYGWPACEGMCADPAYDDPVFTYPHAGSGASVTGGIVYRGSMFPAELRGAYFYGDYVRGTLRYLTFGAGGEVTGSFGFADDAGSVVSIDEGPDGALYTATIGNGTVSRWTYGAVNAAPQITSATATPTSGDPPLTVSFDGAATDADGNTLTYTWDFGDGTSAPGKSVQHVYQTQGLYKAVLRVSDGGTTTSSTEIPITVGAPRPPVASIVKPADGSFFVADERIRFVGSATDPDELLDGSTFRWNVQFLHNDHTHPVIDEATGLRGSFRIPISGHDYASNTRYRITLTVTDSTGLTDTRSVTVWPKKVMVSLASNVPGGHPVTVDSIPGAVPTSFEALIGFQHEIEAPATVCSGGVLHQFQSWSNGGTRQQVLVVPPSDMTLESTYTEAGTC